MASTIDDHSLKRKIAAVDSSSLNLDVQHSSLAQSMPPPRDLPATPATISPPSSNPALAAAVAAATAAARAAAARVNAALALKASSSAPVSSAASAPLAPPPTVQSVVQPPFIVSDAAQRAAAIAATLRPVGAPQPMISHSSAIASGPSSGAMQFAPPPSLNAALGLPLNAPAVDSAAMARVMSIAATLDPQRQKAAAAEAQKKLIWGAKAEKSSNASSLWNAAEFGDSAEKTKFMKLMGAYKGKNKPVETSAPAADSLASSEPATSSDAHDSNSVASHSTDASAALAKSRGLDLASQRQLHDRLEQTFVHGTHQAGSHSGLGFHA